MQIVMLKVLILDKNNVCSAMPTNVEEANQVTLTLMLELTIYSSL